MKVTHKTDWGHCPGTENPADLGSRGMAPSKLNENELWWSGPKWLSGSEDTWPRCKSFETPESKDEAKKVVSMNVRVKETVGIDKVVDLEKYSSLERILRITRVGE